MIADGTTITFDVQGTTGEFLPRAVASVRAIVVDALTPFFDVMDVSIVALSVWSDPAHALSNWPYTAVVRANVRGDYGDVRDVDSLVAHAFYEGAGNVPTVTARGLEQGQGAAVTLAGVGLTTILVLLAVGLVAFAVIKVT